MPIYEYTCLKCEKTFDHLQRTMADAAPPPCPNCNSKKTVRALSVFAVTSEAGKAAAEGPMCHCGQRPGSCGG